MSMEQLWDQIGHDLGWHDHNMRRDRPYSGQPHTDAGDRGKQEIRGVTMRDVRDCFIRAVLLSTGGSFFSEEKDLSAKMQALYEQAQKGENAVLCENDLYGFNLDKLDPIAIVQNLTCEIERVMGIYPNVPQLERNHD
jgi:intracellular sulfur oxidation DsrE/DsrF family protein